MVGISVMYWDDFDKWHFYKKNYRKSRFRKKGRRYLNRIKKFHQQGLAILIW